MLARSSSFSNSESGFSLVETLVATAILATSLVSLAELFVIATKSNAVAKNGGTTMILAQQKMEQLRGLTWGFDLVGLPLSDTTTDTATAPETAGGTGLLPSPANSLWANTDGYVDYINAPGQSLGGGTSVPTVYVRHNSIADNLDEQVVLGEDRYQVPVRDRSEEAARLTFSATQHDQTPLLVKWIAIKGVHPLGCAIVAGQILRCQNRNDPSA